MKKRTDLIEFNPANVRAVLVLVEAGFRLMLAVQRSARNVAILRAAAIYQAGDL